MLIACFLLLICKSVTYRILCGTHGPTLVRYTVPSVYLGGSVMLASSGPQLRVLLLHFLTGEGGPVLSVVVLPTLLDVLCTGLILAAVLVFLYVPVVYPFLLRSLLHIILSPSYK